MSDWASQSTRFLCQVRLQPKELTTNNGTKNIIQYGAITLRNGFFAIPDTIGAETLEKDGCG